MSAIELFNKNLVQFLDNLSKILSNDYYSKLIDEKKLNMSRILFLKNDILIELFKNNIYEYKDNILKEDISILPIINELELFNGLDIKSILENISDKNKSIFWNYMKAFILLCEKHYYTL